VAKQKHDPHLYELAKRGAEARLGDIIHEAKLLIGLFPHLSDSFDHDELPVSFILAEGRDRAEGRANRPRKPWTAAQRKAVSARMKKYWATRRKDAKV
jgi:hypothetical protein